MLRTSGPSRPRHLLAAASLVALAACRPAPESAPVPESKPVASGPAACDVFRAEMTPPTMASTGYVDTAELRNALISTQSRVAALEAMAEAGPAASALAEEVAAMLPQLDPADGLTEAWTALQAVAPTRARELAQATLLTEASAPRRVAAARTLAASGPEGIAALFEAAGAERADVAAAADMALDEATLLHAREVLDVGFAPDGPCAQLETARCMAMVRELAPFAPQLLDRLPDTPRGHLLAAELATDAGSDAFAAALASDGVSGDDAIDALRSRAMLTPDVDAVPVGAAVRFLGDDELTPLARRELAWLLIERAAQLPAHLAALPSPASRQPADELGALIGVVGVAGGRAMTGADREAVLGWLETTRSETGVVAAAALLASGEAPERVREAMLLATMPPLRLSAAMAVVAPDDAAFAAAVTGDGVSPLLANDLALLRLRAAELGLAGVTTGRDALLDALQPGLDPGAWAALAARLEAGDERAAAYPDSAGLPTSGLAAAWLFDHGDRAAVAAVARRGLSSHEVGGRLAAANLAAARPALDIGAPVLVDALSVVGDEFTIDPVTYRTTLARAIVARGGLEPRDAATLLRDTRGQAGQAGASLVALHALTSCDGDAP